MATGVIYARFFMAIGWGVWLFGSPRALRLGSWWALLLLLPVLLPLWTVGGGRWQNDGSVR